MFARGWTDGLPVVAADDERVARMLAGTTRAPDDVVAVDPARPRRVHGREGRGQRGDGRLPARVPARSCSPRSKPRAPTSSTCTACSPRRGSRARSSIVNGPIARRDRHELGRQRARAGQPRQRDDRARAATRHPQRRRRPARRGRPRHARQSRQVHVLLRRGRSRLAVGAAARRARHRARHHRPSRCSRPKACAASSTSSRANPSRWPARSPRACARSRIRSSPIVWDAMLVVSPEHARVFREAGWTKARLREELDALLQLAGDELVARRRRHRRRACPRRFAGTTAPEVPRRRAAHRARRRRRRAVLGHHRRAGRAARSAASR